MTTYFNDNDNNPATDYTVVLTADLWTTGVVLGAGVDLDLNGFTIHGPGEAGGIGTIGVLSNYADAEVYGGSIDGFAVGVQLQGGDSAVGNMIITNSLARGIGMSGGGNSAYGNVIGNVGSGAIDFYGATAGIAMSGDDNYALGNNVYGLHGRYENVGYIFGGDGVILNCLAQGQNAQGYSMAVWNGGIGSTLTISGSHFWGYDHGVVGTATVEIDGTWIDAAFSAITSSNYVDNGGNTFNVDAPDTPVNGYIIGSAARETLVGGAGDDTLVGAGGADSFFGGAGADTFVFSPDAMCVATDFTRGEDQIYLAYDYASVATWWLDSQHRLMVDHDGAGAQAAQAVAYLPYVDELTTADVHF